MSNPLLIRWAEIYANTEILSPIDRETWRVILETSRIHSSSRVIELASGKGAFANYLAKTVRCKIDGFDFNSEFVDYSNNRAKELELQSTAKFCQEDIKQLQVASNSYDLGVCLGGTLHLQRTGMEHPHTKRQASMSHRSVGPSLQEDPSSKGNHGRLLRRTR